MTGQTKDRLWIGFVLLLAAFLRTANLLSHKAFWGDELFSVLLARKPFWDFLYGVLIDVHPPGHLLLLHACHAVLGGGDWVYRLPSVLSGLALVSVIYLLGCELFEKKTALLASLLACISPFLMQLSNEARSYGLTALAITFASYSFMKSLNQQKWKCAYEVGAILSVYINHFAWIWLLTANLFLLLTKRFKSFLASLARILFYSSPALLLTIHQTLSARASFGADIQTSFPVFQFLKKIFAVLWHAATGYGYSSWSRESLAVYSADPLFWLAATAFGAFLISILYAGVKARKDASLFLLLSSIIPLIVLCFLYPTRLESRYASFVVPPLLIFAAAGFTRFKYGWMGLAPLLLVSLCFTFKTISMPWDPIHREDYRATIDYAFKTADERDAVCGLDRYVQYYGPSGKKPRYYRYATEITVKPNAPRRIFLLEPSLYMDPKKDRKRLDSAERLLGQLGYRLTVSIDFGKNGVYTFVHIFEPKA